MGKNLYRIVRDVTGEAYRVLLEAALGGGGTFSLVWNAQLRFGPTAAAIRTQLRHLQLRHVKRDRWPGTILIGHVASVITYRADPSALPTLLEPGSLLSWRAPKYPEDLSFSTDTGELALVTVAHEGDAWILSSSLARAVGRKMTLAREPLRPEDEQYFERSEGAGVTGDPRTRCNGGLERP
jgi:hypothetical protein